MINAGAILVCALLKTLAKPEMTLAEKFDFTMNYFEVHHTLTKPLGYLVFIPIYRNLQESRA